MKKFCMIILGLIVSMNAYAYSYVFNDCVLNDFYIENYAWNPSAKLESLFNYGNLTFYKDYTSSLIPVGTATSSALSADFSLGSKTATYTCARSASAPATYVDENGVIQKVTTANVGRVRGGYYDFTGFHTDKGLMMETSSSNLITYTDGTSYSTSSGTGWSGSRWTGWGSTITTTGTVTYSTPSESLMNIPSATAQRILYTGIAGDTNYVLQHNAPSSSAGSVANGDKLTASILFKNNSAPVGVTSIYLYITVRDAGGSILQDNFSARTILTNVGNNYILATTTMTVSNASASRASLAVVVNGIDSGDSYDFQFIRPQLEKLAYATSFIPTDTASLTRNSEVLKYENVGNRTQAEESVLMYVTPMFSGLNDGKTEFLLGSDTKSRTIFTGSVNSLPTFRPNEGDSIGVQAFATTPYTIGTPVVVSGVAKHSSPYASIFMNSSKEGQYTSSDYVTPSWGSYFYVGSSSSVASQSNCAIKRVAFYSVAKSDVDVATISATLSS